MVKILKPKIQASGLMDSFELGVMKSVSERVLMPVIGNGSVKSGAIKLVGAGLLTTVSRNKHVSLLSSAVIVDGIEDIVTSLLGGMTGAAGDAVGGNGADW